MPRKPRIAYPGAIYHISVRGNRRQDVFLTDEDHLRFLDQLSEQLVKHQVRLFQYCLMDNHFHLLIETPMGNVSRFMQALKAAYTVYFNKKYNRVGRLFRGRFHSKVVQGDGYLFQLSRYIHLNPVDTDAWKTQPIPRRLQYLKTYRWSSYPAYLGLAQPLEGLEMAPILALVGGQRRKRMAYQEFLLRGLTRPDAEFDKLVEGSSVGIGDPPFLESLLQRGDDPVFRRQSPTFSPDEVMDVVAESFKVKRETIRRRKRGQLARGMAALLMSRHCGISHCDIAAHMGLGDGSSVSWHTRHIHQHLRQHPALRCQLERAEQKLRSLRKTG